MTYECSASFHSSYRRSHISILLHLIPLDRIYHKVHSVRVDEYPGMTSTRKVMEMSIHDFDDTLLAVWYMFYSILHKLPWEHSIGPLFAYTISMIFEGYIYIHHEGWWCIFEYPPNSISRRVLVLFVHAQEAPSSPLYRSQPKIMNVQPLFMFFLAGVCTMSIAVVLIAAITAI